MEKEKVVVDASIVVKWYLEEEFSSQAIELRDAFGTGKVTILAPSLLYCEALNALRYSGVYREEELMLVGGSLSLYGLEAMEPTREMLEMIAHISLSHDITVYDAAYVVLANLADAILYTTDAEILEKFPGRTRHIKEFKSENSPVFSS